MKEHKALALTSAVLTAVFALLRWLLVGVGLEARCGNTSPAATATLQRAELKGIVRRRAALIDHHAVGQWSPA